MRDWDADTARSKTDETAKMKYDSTEEQDKAIVARVAEVAEKYLDDFMGAFDVTLTDDDMAYLDEKYLPHKIVGAL